MTFSRHSVSFGVLWTPVTTVGFAPQTTPAALAAVRHAPGDPRPDMVPDVSNPSQHESSMLVPFDQVRIVRTVTTPLEERRDHCTWRRIQIAHDRTGVDELYWWIDSYGLTRP
jgi:hypothetical protein